MPRAVVTISQDDVERNEESWLDRIDDFIVDIMDEQATHAGIDTASPEYVDIQEAVLNELYADMSILIQGYLVGRVITIEAPAE